MAKLPIKKRYLSLLITLLLFLFASFYNSSFNTFIPKPTPTPTIIQDHSLVKVTRVIDGDTIELESGKKVRYIGVNTPEIHSPRIPVQCFGKEAAAKNKELVEGKMVRLEKDVSETDKYGRLLRFVFLPLSGSTDEAIFINEYLVKEGYAHADTYPPDVRFADRFVADEAVARENALGLWSQCR